jgi:hypothetical protein
MAFEPLTLPVEDLKGLEQDIIGTDQPGRHQVTATHILFSIAVSLKRIANALTGEGTNIFTAPINSYGEGIGDAIQGQMIRGQRGIDQYEGR